MCAHFESNRRRRPGQFWTVCQILLRCAFHIEEKACSRPPGVSKLRFVKGFVNIESQILFRVDSYRVLMEPELTKTPAASRKEKFPHNYDTKPPKTELPFIEPKQQYPGLTMDNFLNNPQPRKISFLRQNYRFYNTPVGAVSSEKHRAEETQWWKWDKVQPSPDKGAYTLDSTFRDNYRQPGRSAASASVVTSAAGGRHANNPSSEAAVGIGEKFITGRTSCKP